MSKAKLLVNKLPGVHRLSPLQVRVQAFFYEAMQMRSQQNSNWEHCHEVKFGANLFSYENNELDEGLRMELIDTGVQDGNRLLIDHLVLIVSKSTNLPVFRMHCGGWCSVGAVSFLNDCLDIAYLQGAGQGPTTDFTGRGLYRMLPQDRPGQLEYINVPSRKYFWDFAGTERINRIGRSRLGIDSCSGECLATIEYFGGCTIR